jgi:hypothetical protein
MNNENLDVGGDELNLSDELQRFAAELSQLRPREDRLDHERLAFLAGQASMARVASRSGKLLGVRLESRAWPAAFAAMSAVAATLLFLLIVRPESPNVPSIATSKQIQQHSKVPAGPDSSSRDVLTTQDVRFGDLDGHLAKLDAERKASDSPIPAEDRTIPVFTPSAWQQVINELGSSKPLPRKSSSFSQKQGINT